HLLRHCFELRVRRGCRDTRSESPENPEPPDPELRRIANLRPALQREPQVAVAPGLDSPKSFRKYADHDCVHFADAKDTNAFADDRRIGPIMAAPERVTQNDQHRSGIVLRSEDSAQSGFHAERGEKVRRHEIQRKKLAMIAFDERRSASADGDYIAESI